MNKLLVFLGVLAIFMSSFSILHFFGTPIAGLENLVDSRYYSPFAIGVAIVAYGFIRINKLIGILSFIFGGIALLAYFKAGNIFEFFVPYLQWILFALGARSLLLGIFSPNTSEE